MTDAGEYLLYVKLTAADVDLIRRESEARGIPGNQLVVELIRGLADLPVPPVDIDVSRVQ